MEDINGNLKVVYETTVKKQVEEPKKETRTENGETIDVTRTIKTVKPVKLAIIKADRKLFRAAEMFYAKALSSYLKEGLMPYSLVAKRYANDGGPLTDTEKQRLKELRAEAKALEEQFYTLGKDVENSKDKQEILTRINKINMEASNIQNAYADIFDSTAEVKARNDIIEWWVLHILYADLDGKGYKCFFGEGTFEDKLKVLDTFEAKEDPFEIECIKKLSYLISFWFTAKNSVTKFDFDTMEKLYQNTMTSYKVEESEDLKLVDKTEPTPVTT